jgi:hypothetical protein
MTGFGLKLSMVAKDAVKVRQFSAILVKITPYHLHFGKVNFEHLQCIFNTFWQDNTDG